MAHYEPRNEDAKLLKPVSPGERILELDVLRGCALFGVLLAYALWNLGSPPEETYNTADKVLNFVLSGLVDTKAYTLLAMLFGLGFSTQLSRATTRGVSIVPTYCRRLLALIVIGLAHALLLRNGDILVPYACMGFVLLLFRNATNKALVVGIVAGLLYPYVANGIWSLSGIPFPRRPETSGMSYLAGNLAWVRYWYATAITSWPASLPMFLVGFYFGRVQFFNNFEKRTKVLKRAIVFGLAVGLLAFAAGVFINIAWPDFPSPWRRLTLGPLWTSHAWGLAAFYASSLLLLLQRPAWRRMLRPVAAVGRMALTNYLLQAALIVPVCIALNLFERVTPGIGLLLTLGVWAIQVPASVWWLARFQYGPVEWAWRSLTYGRLQPMRVQREVAAASA